MKRKPFKLPPRKPSGLLKSNPSSTLSDGGRNYTEPNRFKSPTELLTSYEACRKMRRADKQWVNIVKAYDRVPYKSGDGAVLPNFGTLRGQIDKALTTYTDFATERPNWCDVDTDHGDTSGQNALWSTHIKFGLQKYLFKRWDKAFSEVMLGAKDMLLFSKGAYVYFDDDAVYPENIDINHVWPDANAGMFTSDFDTCYVHRRYTAVQLFNMVSDDDVAEISGWNKASVLRLLKSANGSMKDASLDKVFLAYKEGSVGAAQSNVLIDVIYGFVTEYNKEGKKSISTYAIPARAHVPAAKGKSGEDPMDKMGFLLYRPNCAEKMEHRINLVAHTVCRNFYEDPSFAQLIYTMSKTYDMVMNRVLQAVEDNMRIYIKSSSTEAMRKLQRARHGNVQVLDPSIEIIQQQIKSDTSQALNTLRTLIIDQSSNWGQYLAGGTDEKSQPKTAHQTNIDFQESGRISTSQLKIYNCYMTIITCEMVRRFLSFKDKDDADDCFEFRQFKKFRKYLKSKGVPDEAWSQENLIITSVYNAGAGSPTAKLQAATVVLNALAQAPRSEGERLAQRDMVIAAVGAAAAEAYMPSTDDIPVPEDSLIGLENDALSTPNANPMNIPVLKEQLHMRHIPSHVKDGSDSLGIAQKLLQSLDQFPQSMKGVMIAQIQNILIGVDNKLAHAQAHIQVALKDGHKGKLDEIKAYAAKIGELNKMQDELEHNIGELTKALLESDQQANAENPELSHKKAMYAIEEDHVRQMNAFDAETARSKATQLSQQSADRAALDQALKNHEAQNKAFRDSLMTEVKLALEVKKAKGKTPPKSK